MSEKEEFETDKYKFKVYREPKIETAVQIEVVPKLVENLNEDKEEIVNMLKDMGKWESLIKAGQLLLKDIGIKREGP